MQEMQPHRQHGGTRSTGLFELVVAESNSRDTNCSVGSFEMVRELTRP